MNIANIFLTFRKQLIVATIVILLFFSGKWYVDTIKTESYNQGFSVANEAWMTKGKEYVGIINDKYRENTELQNKLMLESEAKDKAKQDLQNLVDKGTDEYSKAPAAKDVLDDQFINLYNQSLGTK